MMAKMLHRCLLPLVAAVFLAAAPAPVKTQVPGWYRLETGNFQVTALYDGYLRMKPALLHNIAPGEVPSLLQRAFIDTDAQGMKTSVNAFLVHTGDHLILVDAGLRGCLGDPLGHMLENLRASGYRPEEVDAVLLTHMHDDHVCGLAEDGKRVFPNATVYAAEAEAAFWLDGATSTNPSHRRSERVLKALEPYRAAGALRTFKPGTRLFPGVTALATPGHTPGHTSYLFESNGQGLLVLGDIVHVEAVQFPHPEVTMAYDADQPAAAKTRAALFATLAEKGWIVAGAHLHFPGLGRIRRDGMGYVYVPVPYSPLSP
jgi:glyoxylase-like metal-dependent hydrolase (beta-lactamase superfamily II)